MDGGSLFILPVGLTALRLVSEGGGMTDFGAEAKWSEGERNATGRDFIPKDTASALGVPPPAPGLFANTVCLADSILLVFSFPPFFGMALGESTENPFWIRPAAVNPENVRATAKNSPDGLGDF